MGIENLLRSVFLHINRNIIQFDSFEGYQDCTQAVLGLFGNTFCLCYALSEI